MSPGKSPERSSGYRWLVWGRGHWWERVSMRVNGSMKVVTGSERRASHRSSSQSDREWIADIQGIYTAWYAIPPSIIYKGRYTYTCINIDAKERAAPTALNAHGIFQYIAVIMHMMRRDSHCSWPVKLTASRNKVNERWFVCRKSRGSLNWRSYVESKGFTELGHCKHRTCFLCKWDVFRDRRL